MGMENPWGMGFKLRVRSICKGKPQERTRAPQRPGSWISRRSR